MQKDITRLLPIEPRAKLMPAQQKQQQNRREIQAKLGKRVAGHDQAAANRAQRTADAGRDAAAQQTQGWGRSLTNRKQQKDITRLLLTEPSAKLMPAQQMQEDAAAQQTHFYACLLLTIVHHAQHHPGIRQDEEAPRNVTVLQRNRQ
jgi:hypothetical protein